MFGHWNSEYWGQPFRPENDVEQMRRNTQILRDEGIRMIFFAAWNGLHPNMEMWPYYGDAMRSMPGRFSWGGYKECTYGGYGDYLTRGAVWLHDNLGAEGVYLDGVAIPAPCLQHYHGCGFEDPDTGGRIVDYDFWGRRDMMKRLYKIFNGEVVQNGMVYSHGSFSLPSDTFATFRGRLETQGWEAYLNLDAQRADLDARSWGIPVEYMWRNGHPVPRNFAQGVAAIHGNRLKLYPHYMLQPNRYLSTYAEGDGIDWRTMVPRQWFDWDRSWSWHPYWENQDVLQVSGATDVPASFHINDAGQVIFAVANMTRQDKTASFMFNVQKLGLPATLHARDVVTHETFEIRQGRFDLKVLGHNTRLLMIDMKPVPLMGYGVKANR